MAGKFQVRPRERLVQIGLTRPEIGEGGSQHQLERLGSILGLIELEGQIGAAALQVVDARSAFRHRQRANARQVHTPPDFSVGHDFLPRRVADQTVEAAAPFPQEHFGEHGREMHWLQARYSRPHSVAVRKRDQGRRIKILGKIAGVGAVSSHHIEDRNRWLHSFASLLVSLAGFGDLIFGGIGGAGQTLQRPFRLSKHLL